jgi:hypothetical protein
MGSKCKKRVHDRYRLLKVVVLEKRRLWAAAKVELAEWKSSPISVR